MYNYNGSRKYLNSQERLSFIKESRCLPVDKEIFCRVMAETGCRISEALSLQCNQIDLINGYIRFESLKKRRRGVYRSVPISDSLARKLSSLHKASHHERSPDQRLWPWSRVTAYRLIVSVMDDARIDGPHATPRGLRHGFAVAALESGIPITLVQRWLGHASLKATAIYAEVVGHEERRIASRMWGARAASRHAGMQ